MRFRVTMIYEYEVQYSEAEEAYGTNDPTKMAELDRENLLMDPNLVDLLTDFSAPTVITVVPVTEE